MSDRYVAIARYDNVPLAELVRLRLEAAGIAVRIENVELVNVLWHYGTAFGHVQLLVPEESAQAALDVIAKVQESSLPGDGRTADDGKPQCLACGAEFPADSDRCSACGWSYSDDVPVESKSASPSDVDDGEDADSEPFAQSPEGERTSLPLTQLRSVGRPLISVWVASSIAMLVLGILLCVLSIIGDMFR